MIIYNPTQNELVVMIKGKTYVAPANGQVSNVPSEHAEYWKQSLHSFIEIRSEDEVAVETPKVEEVKEEVKVVVEKPVMVSKSTKPKK